MSNESIKVIHLQKLANQSILNRALSTQVINISTFNRWVENKTNAKTGKIVVVQ